MNQKLYATLTNSQKALHMATGRVTVAHNNIPVCDENGNWIGWDTKYIAMLRGMVVSTGDQYRFDTREEALADGKAAHAKYTADAKAAGLL